MDNVLHIVSKPDNLPIVAMVVALVGLLAVWWREARRNDRLIAEGRRDEIGRCMRR